MQVKPNQVPIKCDCEQLFCEQYAHVAGACARPAVVKVRAFGLAANLCGPCRSVFENSVAEATFAELPTQPQSVELKTPKGKTFPRAARVHQGHPADCKVCAFWTERELEGVR